MRKPILFYFTLIGLVPILFLTGGAESQFRYLYYPIMVLFIPVLNSKDIFPAALTFGILYLSIPFARGGDYPFYTVAINSFSFMLMAIVSGRLSDEVQKEKKSLHETKDVFHNITHDLNLQVMNLQSQVDSFSESYDRLKELDKNRTHFIANVSHELRSPLSSIRSFSEILLQYDDIDADTKKEFLGIINAESERLGQMTNELLDIFRMETGKTQWHIDTTINMADIIRSTVKTMLPVAESKGLSLETGIPDKILLVKGDKNRLVQVMLNLLNNAIKFTPQGKITAGVEDMPDEMKIYVSDTGEGIYPEEKEKIFDEFYRIGDELYGRPKGYGLGLSISKKIVEVHGGRIWVESRIGKGSTFYFTLPKEDVTPKTAAGKAPRIERSGVSVDIMEKQVLVLEGDKLSRQILRRALETHGYKTRGAESIKTALELIKLWRPDAIITGYPKSEDHFDEFRTLSRSRAIPFFFVYVIDDEKIGPQIAVNRCISKPFDNYQIHTTAEEVIRSRRGTILIISGNSQEARDLQLYIGAKGYYETVVFPGIDDIDLTKHFPDLIIIGTLPGEEVYRTVNSLRRNRISRDIPLVLTLNVSMRDIKCIGLDSSKYGSGLDKLYESLSGGT